MKKIVFAGIVSALTAVMSTAAFADSAQGNYLTAEKSGGKYVNGESVTFSVKVTQSGIKSGGFIVNATGLELSDYNVTNGTFDAGSGTARFSGDSFDKDSTVATFTYKVTAKTGENVRFAISDHADFPGAVNTLPVTGMVVEGTAQSTPATSGTNSGTSSDVNSGNSNGTTGNPTTGIASAVVPAILAGAAVVVAARKRK